MLNSLVFHHTPVLPMMEPSPWVVLEYASPDAKSSVVGLFRTSQSGDPVFRFYPRGVDGGCTYRVQFGNSGQSVVIPGDRLIQEGIPVRLSENLTSEMLILQAK
jgi:hypothetical protein